LVGEAADQTGHFHPKGKPPSAHKLKVLEQARTLAYLEAVIGQLYIGVLIASLVGCYIASSGFRAATAATSVADRRPETRARGIASRFRIFRGVFDLDVSVRQTVDSRPCRSPAFSGQASPLWLTPAGPCLPVQQTAVAYGSYEQPDRPEMMDDEQHT